MIGDRFGLRQESGEIDRFNQRERGKMGFGLFFAFVEREREREVGLINRIRTEI